MPTVANKWMKEMEPRAHSLTEASENAWGERTWRSLQTPEQDTAVPRQLGVYFYVGQSQKQSCNWGGGGRGVVS